MWDVLGLGAICVLILVAFALELGLEPKNPIWKKRWGWFAGIVMVAFVLWMIILFGFIK